MSKTRVKSILALLLVIAMLIVLAITNTAHAELLIAKDSGSAPSTMRCSAYANGITIEVGDNGCIQTSTDGLTWTTQTSNTTNALNSIVYGGTTFVAVGDSGTIVTSTDGITWTVRTSGTSSKLTGIAYGSGKFVIAGQLYTGYSTDGISWTQNNYFMSSTSFNYTGNAQTFKAPVDGDYTLQTWGASGGAYYNGTQGKGGYATGTTKLTAGQSVYVYVGQVGWITNMYYDNGTFNGGGSTGYMGYSGGGATDVRTVSGAWSDAAGLKSRIIVAGGGGGARSGVGGYGGGLSGGYGLVGGKQSAAPGTQTTGYALGQGQACPCNYEGGGGGGYYGGYANNSGSGGGGGSSYIDGVTNGSTIAGNAVMPSTTGGTETGHNGNGYAKISWSSTSICSIAYGNNTFVALDTDDTVYSSSDGITWTTKSNKSGLTTVKYMNNNFYGIGKGGMIIESSDLSSWTTLNSTTANDLYDMAYGNGIYTVVGNNEEVLASRNGTTWKEQKSNTGSTLYSVSYNDNGEFIAVGTTNLNLKIGDTTPPVITLTPSTATLTNSDVTITANIAEDNDFKSYWSTDENAKASGTQFNGTFVVGSNNTYYVYAIDSYGNESQAQIDVTNIDKTPPVISLSKSTDGPTQNVTINVNVTDNYDRGQQFFYYNAYEDRSDYRSEIYDNAPSGSTSFIASENRTYYILTQDAAGNYAHASITISNIDRTPPSITLTPSTTDLTRKLTVNAKVTDANTTTSYWSTNESAGATGTEFTDGFDVTANGTYYVYAVDVAGNGATQSIQISNINTAPEITLSASKSPTNKPATVTASIRSLLTYKSYWSTNADDKDKGTEFTGSFNAPSNGTYYVYAVDTDNKSDISSINVASIDTTPPTVQTSASSVITNKPVEVIVTTTDTNSVTTYWSTSSTAGASGTQFNGSFDATTNGIYYIYALDAAGNGTTTSVTVSTIDTTAPTMNLVETPLTASQYVTITANATDDNGAKTYWSTSPTAGASGTEFTGSFNVAANTTYYVYAVDPAGNSSTASIAITNISVKDDKGNTGTGTQADSKTGNNSNVPIVATTDPIVFKAIVPLSLPADVDRSGVVTTATNAEITNQSSYGCIKIVSINTFGTNDWSLTNYTADFGAMKVGTKQFALVLNNNIADSSTGIIGLDNTSQIDVSQSQHIDYMMKIPPQTKDIINCTIGQVVFTIDWYK